MKELQKALGLRVRELRLIKGFSQEAFADYCGLHRTYMGNVERGTVNISFQNLARIAGGLEVPVSILVTGVEERAAEPESLKGAGVTRVRVGRPRKTAA